MSAVVPRTWAGRPSRIAVSEGPWDSPAVSQRSMGPVFHAGFQAPGRPSVTETLRQPGPDHHGERRTDQHEGPVGHPTARVAPHRVPEHPPEPTDDDHDQGEPHQHLVPAEVAERWTQDTGE